MYYARVHVHVQCHACEGSVPQLESENCKQRDMRVEKYSYLFNTYV